MKVTVCFGPVSVVVPCGNGDILVRDLISQAITRYRKAANKSNDVPISVSALRSSDGAILDPDDRLADVVDDREQLAACLTGEQGGLGPNLRGDGTSASSNSGSPSPDFLHHHYNLVGQHLQQQQQQHRKDIEVTGQEVGDVMADHLHLQVRRGSEPALNRISPGPHSSGSSHISAEPPREYKRWSAAPIVDPTGSDSDDEGNKRRSSAEPVVRRHPSGTRFARSGARVSMQIFGGSGAGNGTGYRWAEAADNALLSSAVAATTPASSSSTLPPDYEETMHRRTRSLRREPVGATSDQSIPLSDGHSQSLTQLVVLPNEGGPLGIHVVPDYSPLGGELGLLVQGVEPGGRIHRDGRIAVQDRIVEINSHPLKDVPFHRAQELFRNALQSRDLRLRVIKSTGLESHDATDRSEEPQHNSTAISQGSTSSRVAAVSPNRKPAALPGAGRAASALMTISTRKIGKKMDLELIKGQDGLGFSVTTRDNPAGGLCPIYIKNILPKGAAIEDGRLRSGDRLLEVNGAEITGKSQSEVVALLRNIPSGGRARLLISRQTELDEETAQSNQPLQTSPKLPRQMKSMASRASEESLLQLPWKQREILTLDIPVHDTEKAGLGISVKGKTTSSSHPNGQSGTTDLGIFIKSVLHGGAASRDGRLLTNDQLLHVNGVSLLKSSNTEAMEGLRRAVHQEGPKPGHITLTIARKVHNFKDREAEGQADDTNGTVRLGAGDSSSSYDQSGGSSDQSGSTVIFVSGSGSDSRERNLVKDRLSGLSDLRNESYYRATHETWNTTQLQESLGNSKSNGQHSSSSGRRVPSQNSPTVHLTPGEVVSIDGDYLPQTRPRPPSMMLMTTNGSTSALSSPDNSVCSPWQAYGRQQQRSGPTDGRDRPWADQPQSPSECSVRSSDRPSDSEAPTYASQTSLEDPNAPGFSRDQFGRQSMSEKRHASLDAKNTDTYQRNKKLREERERQKQQEPEQQPQQQQQQQLLQQQQQQQQHNHRHQQAAKENVPPTGRLIRRAIKRRHAHPLVSRLEKDYLTSPTYHRSSPNLYEPDVVTVVRRGAGTMDRGSRLSMAPSLMSIATSGHHRVPSVESLFVKPIAPSPLPSTPRQQQQQQQRPRYTPHSGRSVPRPLPVRDIGPTLGLKKSSSLESLQTVVQEMQMQEEDETGPVGCYGYQRPTAIRVVRGRGCNESFRAAVDRSYVDGQNNPQAVDANKEPMETLDEEAIDVQDSLPRSPSDNTGALFNNKNEVRKSQKKKNGNNAAGLLLRGLGSMFRFGKHRKSAPSSPETGSNDVLSGPGIIMSSTGHQQERRPSHPAGGSIGRSTDVDRHHVLRRTLPPDERDRAELSRQMAMAVARQAAQEEQKRIQHHYQRLMDQQQRQQQQAQQQKQQAPPPAPQQGQHDQQPQNSMERSQRLHQLRAQHQKRHAETQRQAVHSPTEQFEANRPEVMHGRSASYDPYNDVRKPRSRAAVGEPNTLMPIGVPPPQGGSYNNNYDDFQIKNGHLNQVQIREMQELVRLQRLKVEGQIIRRQQHYHSQRSARETRMSPPSGANGNWSGVDRPVSNYFEYESLHIAGHTVALSGPPYKPQQQPVVGRRLPNAHNIPPTEDGATYFRRQERTTPGQDYGSYHARSSQRESVYGGMGNGNPGRPIAPLAGSKV